MYNHNLFKALDSIPKYPMFTYVYLIKHYTGGDMQMCIQSVRKGQPKWPFLKFLYLSQNDVIYLFIKVIDKLEQYSQAPKLL